VRKPHRSLQSPIALELPSGAVAPAPDTGAAADSAAPAAEPVVASSDNDTHMHTAIALELPGVGDSADAAAGDSTHDPRIAALIAAASRLGMSPLPAPTGANGTYTHADLCPIVAHLATVSTAATAAASDLRHAEARLADVTGRAEEMAERADAVDAGAAKAKSTRCIGKAPFLWFFAPFLFLCSSWIFFFFFLFSFADLVSLAHVPLKPTNKQKKPVTFVRDLHSAIDRSLSGPAAPGAGGGSLDGRGTENDDPMDTSGDPALQSRVAAALESVASGFWPGRYREIEKMKKTRESCQLE
jgi:hypothetical protein